MDIVASGLRGFRLLDYGSSMVTVVTWRSQKLVGGSAQQVGRTAKGTSHVRGLPQKSPQFGSR